MERAKRIGLRAAMIVIAINVWTGSPLFALWVGSKIQGSGPPRMAPLAAVVAVFAIVSFLLATALAWLGSVYDEITGQPAQVRRHVPWLRSMRGERPQYDREQVQSTGLERTLVYAVGAAFVVFEIWFFFFAGSPLGSN